MSADWGGSLGHFLQESLHPSLKMSLDLHGITVSDADGHGKTMAAKMNLSTLI